MTGRIHIILLSSLCQFVSDRHLQPINWNILICALDKYDGFHEFGDCASATQNHHETKNPNNEILKTQNHILSRLNLNRFDWISFPFCFWHFMSYCDFDEMWHERISSPAGLLNSTTYPFSPHTHAPLTSPISVNSDCSILKSGPNWDVFVLQCSHTHSSWNLSSYG